MAAASSQRAGPVSSHLACPLKQITLVPLVTLFELKKNRYLVGKSVGGTRETEGHQNRDIFVSATTRNILFFFLYSVSKNNVSLLLLFLVKYKSQSGGEKLLFIGNFMSGYINIPQVSLPVLCG